MATVDFENAYNEATDGVFGRSGNSHASKVSIANANDIGWLKVSGPCNILVNGGSAFTLEVYRATLEDLSDDVLVDTQDESERTARYDFVGPGWVGVKPTDITDGPLDIRITQG